VEKQFNTFNSKLLFVKYQHMLTVENVLGGAWFSGWLQPCLGFELEASPRSRSSSVDVFLQQESGDLIFLFSVKKATEGKPHQPCESPSLRLDTWVSTPDSWTSPSLVRCKKELMKPLGWEVKRLPRQITKSSCFRFKTPLRYYDLDKWEYSQANRRQNKGSCDL